MKKRGGAASPYFRALADEVRQIVRPWATGVTQPQLLGAAKKLGLFYKL